MNQASSTEQSNTGSVQTTGHAWDGDLQEYNNPLPRWWVWSFYATAVFCLIYWLMYPAWPIGSDWTRGFSTVTYETADGAEKTVPWNSRAQLIEELQSSPSAERQRAFMEQVAGTSYADMLEDPEILAFAQSVGRGLFGDNCAACHGSGGQGVIGLFPNLADDDWLWGGTPEDIQQTLHNGRNGYMPGYAQVLSDEQLTDVAAYVLTLSDLAPADEASARGEVIFQGPVGGCWQCHTPEGTGLQSLGSANLTDAIWTIARVPEASDTGARIEVVKNFVSKGVLGTRVMPAWDERLTATDLKVLSVYVHQLGGGE